MSFNTNGVAHQSDVARQMHEDHLKMIGISNMKSQSKSVSQLVDMQQKSNELYEKVVSTLENQVAEMKEQNELLHQQLEDTQTGLKKSTKFNVAMLVVSIISAITAIVVPIIIKFV